MPAATATTQPAAPPEALVAAWTHYIRATEDSYQPPVRLSPEEVQTAAALAARLGQEPPPAPGSRREAVLTH